MKWVMSAALACLLLCGLAACVGGVENPTTTAAPETVPMPTADPEIELTTQVVEAMIDPDFDAEALFQRLEGVWDDSYEFPGFMSFIYRDSKPSLYRGVYDGDTDGIGTLSGGRENEGIATLYFLYPATEGEDGQPVPERTTALQIDVIDMDNEALRVKSTTIWGIHDWHTYTYNCKTLREAGIRAIW